ncbi:hypothetical protein CEXT_385111 [Caerostris extrusa]|uniref:Uncharacterized protein n=1 Tax=Caerostris extrusa TaxID=172846 RepID=A0AAV4P3S1_CAEEX|nr:hypothetical protein CEXT_385111 [Caerostris extrusa]
MCFKPCTHVIIDLDGTFLDTEDIYMRIYQKYAEMQNRCLTWRLREKVIGKSAKQALLFLSKELNFELIDFQHFSEEELVGAEAFKKCQLKPGAERLIRHFHENGIPIGLVAHTDPSVFRWKTLQCEHLIEMFYVVNNELQDSSLIDGYMNCATRIGALNNLEQVLIIDDCADAIPAAEHIGMQIVSIPDARLDKSLFEKAHRVHDSLYDFRPEEFGLPAYYTGES